MYYMNKCKHPPKIVFSIGRLTKRKCFDEIIKSAEIVSKKDKGIIFLIAGKGEEYDHLKEMIDKKGLENVKLLGFVDDKKREDLFLMSDICIYASEFEGSGIVYTEAMSFSTPVIAYENEAVKDIIEDKKYGLVTERNPKEMAKAVIYLLKNKEEREQIVRNAHNLIKKIHNWDVYAKKYIKEIRKLIL